jgi:hypothetical protein
MHSLIYSHPGENNWYMRESLPPLDFCPWCGCHVPPVTIPIFIRKRQ